VFLCYLQTKRHWLGEIIKIKFYFMEFTKKEDLEKLQPSLLVREADLIIKFVNEAREQLKVIKNLLDSHEGQTGQRFYEGDLLMESDREMLKKAIGYIVALDEVTEEKIDEWRTSSDLILEIGDFYNLIENDNELRPYLSGKNSVA